MRRRGLRTSLAGAVAAGAAMAVVVAPPAQSAAASGPQTAAVSAAAAQAPLAGENLMYPRVVRLAYSGSANGTLVADATGFPAGGPVGAVYQSTDGGAHFSRIGQVSDPLAQSTGLCCTTLFELPRQIGALPAGTLLWAGSVGQDAQNRRMAIRVWSSADHGRTWSYLSTIATSANTGGLWEPDFFIDAAGRLAAVFSDESQPGQSQELVEAASYDAVNWSARRAIVTGSSGAQRPGMGTVVRLPDGSYLMSYEVCGQAPSRYDCAAYTRTSADGADWGSPADLGTLLQLPDGTYVTNAPLVAVTPQGALVAVAQNLRDANGATDPASGQRLFFSATSGRSWSAIPAPVAVPSPKAGPCDNYSSALLPSSDGRGVLEIATRDTGSGCTAYVASGALPTSAASIVGQGSGKCLDASGGGTANGTPVITWSCHGGANQQWTLEGDGTIRNPVSGRCLEVQGGVSATGNGTKVGLWDCWGGANQKWTVLGDGTVRNPNSGRCLEVAGGPHQNEDGQPVQIWDCWGGDNQKWAVR